MLDVKPALVAQLETVGLPVYYELYCDSSTETPCITYIENNNYDHRVGSTFGYSKVSFIIKLWGDDMAELSQYAVLLDQAMREIGYTRNSANELVYETQIQKIFTYEGMGIETY